MVEEWEILQVESTVYWMVAWLVVQWAETTVAMMAVMMVAERAEL